MEIKDSGTRRVFTSGAVRDINEGKGRCDLLPLNIISRITHDEILADIYQYIYSGSGSFLLKAISTFSETYYQGLYTAFLEVSKHYQEGCEKYGERNWERGLPLHCYIDSALRHYFKFRRGDEDEPHDRAFLWNLFGALWTQGKFPELCDLPFVEVIES